jgi:hypothetical protein
MFDGILYSYFEALCPSNCAEKTSATVYGSDVFHYKSSICRAGVKIGAIPDD